MLDILPVEAKASRKRIRGMFDLIDALFILPLFLSLLMVIHSGKHVSELDLEKGLNTRKSNYM